jgi:hypothetical protein
VTLQGYELVQGALVRWTQHRAASRPPPTAVLVHGILGSRRNMLSFANRLVEVRLLHEVAAKCCDALCSECAPSVVDALACSKPNASTRSHRRPCHVALCKRLQSTVYRGH